LTFSQSNMVVGTSMVNPDGHTVLKLGTEIDAKLVAAGFTR
jgi:hypothetical protein